MHIVVSNTHDAICCTWDAYTKKPLKQKPEQLWQEMAQLKTSETSQRVRRFGGLPATQDELGCPPAGGGADRRRGLDTVVLSP